MEKALDIKPQNDNITKSRITRCVDWLQKQNDEDPKKSENKNDIQFIIQNNAERKKFLLSSAEDVATVPAGIDEPEVESKHIPIRRLRVEGLRMECEWQSCRWFYSNYEQFQTHVKQHIRDLHVIDNKEYVCLWDICGYKTSDADEVVRHVNYHAYHAKLLAIGLNARDTLNLSRCGKDSSKRNLLPPLKSDHVCMWTGCEEKFNAIQLLFDHVRLHCEYAERAACSWAGCGARFPRRPLLYLHVRAHTGERLIACYHCGHHYASNRKLSDHLLRQNAESGMSHQCGYCGTWCGSAYLMREHARQHVSQHACSLCDMSAPSLAALAQHVRYIHLRHLPETRAHRCPHCTYKAVTKSDLRKHVLTHKKKKPLKRNRESSDEENSDTDEEVKKKPIQNRKYACHMCPEESPKIFTRGSKLTKHLVKIHGAQWPFGYSRFRYQISEDGMYRLTTTRYETLEVSKKIVDGYSGPKDSITNSYDFNIELKAEPTLTTPMRFEVTLKNTNEETSDKNETKLEDNSVEITMCDVDEKGNIIKSAIFKDVVYT